MKVLSIQNPGWLARLTPASTGGTNPPSTQTQCSGTKVILNVYDSGYATFQWYKNGTTAPFRLTELASVQSGVTTNSLTLVSISTTANYYLIAKRADNSTTTFGPYQVVVNNGCNGQGTTVSN